MPGGGCHRIGCGGGPQLVRVDQGGRRSHAGGEGDRSARVPAVRRSVRARLAGGRLGGDVDVAAAAWRRVGRVGAGAPPGSGGAGDDRIHQMDLDVEAARVLTQRKVVDYLRRRRGAAIAAGAYTLEVV